MGAFLRSLALFAVPAMLIGCAGGDPEFFAAADTAGTYLPGHAVSASGYRVRGDREVRPSSIRDDGSKTFIAFAPDQALPAVFSVGATGKEEVVNGYMRGDLYVLDRTFDRLVFRIDRLEAIALRVEHVD
tara:strand:- start:755 stop:1144 length:390 start_codon:yes stop_codon:yes gene_type:complete